MVGAHIPTKITGLDAASSLALFCLQLDKRSGCVIERDLELCASSPSSSRPELEKTPVYLGKHIKSINNNYSI